MRKYAKHFQAIIGLIPVLEEASHSILTPSLPLLSSSPFCSLTLPSLHFPQSLQPCFFPFIPTVSFLHPPHPSYLLLFPHLSSLRHCLTLFCAMCASRLLLLLTPLLLYLHPFALLNPEASMRVCARRHTDSFAFNHIRTHKLTCTFWLFSHMQIHKIGFSSSNLIVRQTPAVMILRGN